MLRAKAFREGLEPTNVDTQTHLFTNHVLEQPDEIPGYPSLVMRTSGSTSATLDYGMDPEIARDPAYRERLLDGLESIPSISLVLPKEHMFGHGGIYYATDGNGPTHAASVEVLYADEPDASFQVDCGLESHATVAVKRSFKLKFQSEFGPGKLVTPFFRGSPLNGDSATTVIDRIVLRAGNERSFALRGYPVWSKYSNAQRVSSLHLSKGCLNPASRSDTYSFRVRSSLPASSPRSRFEPAVRTPGGPVARHPQPRGRKPALRREIPWILRGFQGRLSC